MKVAGAVVSTIRSLTTEYSTCLELLVLPKIATDLPSETIDVRDWAFPKRVRLADPQFNERSSIDLLIGVDTFMDIIKSRKIRLECGLPTLLETELGWIVSGACTNNKVKLSMACTIQRKEEESDIGSLMNAFFNIEEVIDQSVWSVEEQECEDYFQATKRRECDGRYIVRLPFKTDRELGRSKEIAMHRLKGLERRFEREPKLKEAYESFMREYFANEVVNLKEGKQVSRKSPLRALKPVMGKDNIMRVGGRLSNADITEEQKHPIIIPGKHRLAELIASKYHEILRHAAVQLTINTIQLKYWIIGSRNVVKRTIFNCVK
uniref:DUF1758 domain-containing protein n=1 Tax=Anopheles epiroticus TaxID=199890 RepID=A0A182PX65_9DIPT